MKFASSLCFLSLTTACLRTIDDGPQEECETCDPASLVTTNCPENRMCEIKDASTSFDIVHTSGGCLEIVANCEGFGQVGFNFGGDQDQEWGFLPWTENLFQLRDIRLICNDNGDWVIIVGNEAATPIQNLICLNFLG